MVNLNEDYKWYQPIELRTIADGYYPNYNFSTIENETYGIYFVDYNNFRTIYKTTDEGENVSEVETRAGMITFQSFWHDRTNNYLYGLSYVSTTNLLDIFYVDMPNLDNIVELGSPAAKYFKETGDIFVIGGSVYVLAYYWNSVPNPDQHTIEVYKWTGAAWNLEASQLIAATNLGGNELTSFVCVVSGDVYFIVNNQSDGDAELWWYDVSAKTFTLKHDFTGYELEVGGFDFRSIAFDNDDTLFFTLMDSGTFIDYVCSYEISTDTFTVICEEMTILMLDRNCLTTNPIPFELEKGFDYEPDADGNNRIFQISKNRRNYLAIARINNVSGLVAITDHYIFGLDGKLYTWHNYITAIGARSVIRARQRGYWSADLFINDNALSDEVELFDGQFIQIIGNLSSYGNGDLISYINNPDNFLDIDLTDDDWYFGLPDDFNLETVGTITVAGDMDFIDTLYIPNDCSCNLLYSFNNHHHVLALSMGTGTANPYIIHDFAGGLEATGTREFWVGTSDNTKETDYYFLETSPSRILFKIDAGTFWYDNGGWVDTTIAATNNTLFHVKITWNCVADTYDLYISNALVVAGAAFNVVAAGIDKFYMKLADDAVYTSYLSAWGDPADAGYVVGDNLVGRTMYGTIIPWVDTATLPNLCTCTIEADIDDHKNVLKLMHDAGGSEPSIIHTIDTTEASGTWEWWWGSSDVTRDQQIIFRNVGTDSCIIIRISASKYYYYDHTVATEIVGAVPTNDNLDHFKIVFDISTDHIQLYINGTLRVTDGDFNIDTVTNIASIWIRNITDAAYSQYIGAPSDVADNNYYEGQNTVKTKEDQVIFEGYLHFSDLRNPRKCWVDSPSLFDLKKKLTAGTYGAARTDQNIISILAVDSNYIVEGTMANGIAGVTTIIKGSKGLQTQLNTYGQQDGFTYVIKPDQGQGLLNYNAGTVSSAVKCSQKEKIKQVQGKKQRAIINQVTVKGAINTATGVPYTDTANDTESQKLYGVQPITRTFANLYSNAACLAQATAILTIQQYVPYTYTFAKKIGWEGLVLPSETITLEYTPDSMITSGTRIINALEFYFRAGMCKWEVEDAISYTTEMDLLKQDVEELSDLIEQISADVITKLTSANISDTAFAASWDTVTTIAPSKNAVYDKVITLPTISSGAGAPGSTPTKIGDVYIDTTNLNIYIAGGTGGSYSWGLVGQAQSSSFTKDTVANCVLWFKSDTGITKDGADLVSQWDDQSVSAKNLTQGVAGNKPLYLANQINGYPVIRFDGTDDYMTTGAFVINQPFTIFIVMKTLSSAGAPPNDYWIAMTNALIRESLADQSNIHAGTGLDGAFLVNGTSYLWSCTFNGAASAIGRNADAETTGNAGAGNAAKFDISVAAAAANIDVAEILVYSVAVSAANKTIIRTYLNNKYGLW